MDFSLLYLSTIFTVVLILLCNCTVTCILSHLIQMKTCCGFHRYSISFSPLQVSQNKDYQINIQISLLIHGFSVGGSGSGLVSLTCIEPNMAQPECFQGNQGALEYFIVAKKYYFWLKQEVVFYNFKRCYKSRRSPGGWKKCFRRHSESFRN